MALTLRLLSATAALCLLFAAPGAFAQEPAAPQPDRLQPDWWSYFEPAEDADGALLKARIEAARRGIHATLKQLSEERRRELETLGARLDRSLARLSELSESPPATVPPLRPIPAEHGLEEALEQFNELRRLSRQVRLEVEELDWQEAELAAERRQQSRRRGEYMQLEKTAPERLGRGLELMVSRLSLELRALELKLGRDRLKALQEQLEALEAAVAEVGDRLRASPEERERWEVMRREAEERLVGLRQESETAAGEALPDSLAGDFRASAQARLSLVESAARELELGLAELALSRATLGEMLLTLLSGKAAPGVTERAKELLTAHARLEETLEDTLTKWQRRVGRVQDLTAEQLRDEKLSAAERTLLERILNRTEQVDTAAQRLQQEGAVTAFVASQLEDQRVRTAGWWDRTGSGLFNALARAWAVGVDILGSALFEINETPVTTLGLLRVVVILTLALWLSKGVQRALRHVGERKGGLSQSSLYTLGRVVHYVVLVVGVIIGLSSIGIDFTKFALFASALGVGLGFGLQTLVSNFVAGLIILFEKSLKVGDFVELSSGLTGEVREINMRSTLITTNDNVDILVPNSEFVNGQVTNWTLREAYRRVRIPFGVAYGTDKELVKKAALEAADQVQWTLKGHRRREPQVWFVGFGESSLDFELVIWLTPEAVKRPGAISANYLWELETSLTKHGIEIPFPQRDLHLRSGFDASHRPLPAEAGHAVEG